MFAPLHEQGIYALDLGTGYLKYHLCLFQTTNVQSLTPQVRLLQPTITAEAAIAEDAAFTM